MVSKELVDELFFGEIVKEAKIGKVNAAYITYNIKFDVVYERKKLKSDHMHPILYIENKEQFLDMFTVYVNEILKKYDLKKIDREYIKFFLIYIFLNATYNDFENPIIYISRYISFLNDKTFENYNDIKLMDIFEDSYIKASSDITPLGYEGVNAFSTSINSYNGKSYYKLPTIYYAIDKDICYIYAVQNGTNISNDRNYEKTIKRKLYKVNENVSVENREQFLGTILDVSPSSIIALTIFLCELKNNGISKVKVVSYLPVRYFARLNEIDEGVMMLGNFYKYPIAKKKEIYELEKELIRIQNNKTNKFLWNFIRLAYHFNNIDIISIPMEQEEFMSIYIDEFVDANNKLLKQLLNKNYKTR